MLIGIALLWLTRAVEQIIFYKLLNHWGSWILLTLFLVGVALYGVPVVWAV